MPYIQPGRKFIQVGTLFDSVNGKLRVLTVKPQSRDEVPYHPALSFAVVIKVHKVISN